MKALPKRKGNLSPSVAGHPLRRLNDSPSEKEGKCLTADTPKLRYPVASMKALPKRKGNAHRPDRTLSEARLASMKALPKRKGNAVKGFPFRGRFISLNESPSEKEGKFRRRVSAATPPPRCLNESPSEKEGKFDLARTTGTATGRLNESPSEKVGKSRPAAHTYPLPRRLNESPSEKEGKSLSYS